MVEILQRLGVETPSVDAFVDTELNLCPRWWGPGSSETENAFDRNWGDESLLWMNPPFSLLPRVVDKIHKDGARVVLIMPLWEDREFFTKIQPMILRKCVYPEGSKVFEQKRKAMPGIRWPVWCVLVDGREALSFD